MDPKSEESNFYYKKAPDFSNLISDFINIPKNFEKYKNIIEKEQFISYSLAHYYLLPGCSVENGEIMISDYSIQEFINASVIQQSKMDSLIKTFFYHI
jgi:hypothetical protein